MAAITPTSLHQGGRSGPRIERVDPSQRHAALAVLLTGQVAGASSAVDQFLQFTATQRLSLDELWAAYEGDRPMVCVLVVPSAGRTAMTFLSPTLSHAPQSLHVELLRRACRGQDAQHVRLIQGLLDPDQDAQRRVMEDAGFWPLAELVYMQRRADLDPCQIDLSDMDLLLSCWSEDRRVLFARAIEASYAQTQDCPGLLGFRRIEDVIDGHMGMGRFDPETWFVLHRGDEPAGVMLMNEVTHRQSYELVYLGLAPSYRGRGLARSLLRFGLGLVGARGGSSLLLAVDQDNTPALRLYRQEGFTVTGHKTAMLYLHE
jgi:ribosomal protein S18 acetylase RimI-like enzyme